MHSEKELDKSQLPLLIKTSIKLKKKNFLHTKVYLQKSIAKYSHKILKAFPISVLLTKLLFYFLLSFLAITRKEIKCTWNGKKERKLSLFAVRRSKIIIISIIKISGYISVAGYKLYLGSPEKQN